MRGSASRAVRSTVSASSATCAVVQTPTDGSLSSGSASTGAGCGGLANSSSSAIRSRLGGGGRDRRHPGLGEVGAVGVADPAADPGADADAALGRRGQALHLAAVDADLAAPVAGGVGLSLARPGGEGRLDRPPRARAQLRHSSVPPTVIARTRT